VVLKASAVSLILENNRLVGREVESIDKTPLERVFELPLTIEKESLEDGEIEGVENLSLENGETKNVEKTMTKTGFASLSMIETNCFESEEAENIEKLPLGRAGRVIALPLAIEKESLETVWRHWSCNGLPLLY
jgi:hypothetical protein